MSIHRLTSLLKRFGPWALATLIFILLFRRYPIPNLIASLKLANIHMFIGWALLYFLVIWLVDCWGFSHVLTRIGHPTRPRALFLPRSVSYLLMVLNYGAGQGGFGYLLGKSAGIPLERALGLAILVLFFDLYWVILLAAIGSFLITFDTAGFHLTWFVRGLALAATMIFVLGHYFWKWPARQRIIQWVHRQPVFELFRSSTWKDHLILMSYRLPMHLTIISGLYIVALTFHCYLPFKVAVAGFPLILLIGVLPITPGGLGTTQIATVALFDRFLVLPLEATVSTSDVLLAMSLAWLFANYFLKALWGVLYLRQYTRKTAEHLSAITHRASS